jgi:hypothetical protein
MGTRDGINLLLATLSTAGEPCMLSHMEECQSRLIPACHQARLTLNNPNFLGGWHAAGPATASHLVDGIVLLWNQTVKEDPEEQHRLWQSNLLVKAFCTNPLGCPQLLAAVAGRNLCSIPRRDGASHADPFRSYILLGTAQQGSGTESSPHAWCLHTMLVGEARSYDEHALSLLVSHLACQSLAGPQQRSYVARASTDLARCYDWSDWYKANDIRRSGKSGSCTG